MRVSAVAFLALGSVVLAQNLPECVLNCIAYASTASTCQDISSLGCLCTDTAFVNAAGLCYTENCTPEETATGISTSVAQCAAIGISVSVPSTYTSASATGAATETESSVVPTSSSINTSTVESLTSSVASALSSLSESVASQTESSSSASETETSSSAPVPSATSESSGAGKTTISTFFTLVGLIGAAVVF